MNRKMPAPVDTTHLPLIMPIHEIVRGSKGSGIRTWRNLYKGQLAVGQAVDIVGKGDIELRHGFSARRRMKCPLNRNPDWLSVGQVLCPPKTIKSHSEFTALIYLLTHEESGYTYPAHRKRQTGHLFVER